MNAKSILQAAIEALAIAAIWLGAGLLLIGYMHDTHQPRELMTWQNYLLNYPKPNATNWCSLGNNITVWKTSTMPQAALSARLSGHDWPVN